MQLIILKDDNFNTVDYYVFNAFKTKLKEALKQIYLIKGLTFDEKTLKCTDIDAQKYDDYQEYDDIYYNIDKVSLEIVTVKDIETLKHIHNF